MPAPKVQTTYTSTRPVTLATRQAAYDRVILLCEHLDHLGINLVSIIVNADRTVSVTLDDVLPPEQLSHLGVDW